MSKQIAAVDRAIMNELYAKEYTLISGGSAAVVMRLRRKGYWVGEAAKAFKDHGEYVDTLQDILREFTDWEFDE